MAYDEKRADRIRKRLRKQPGLTEKKRFGGVGFVRTGNLCCGVRGREMIVRLDPEQTDEALAQPHTRVFDVDARPRKGWILVDPKRLTADRQLAKWIGIATKFALALPAKP